MAEKMFRLPEERALSQPRTQSVPLWLVAVFVVPMLVTLAVRVAPLVHGGDRLQRQCVSEDGYLMLTIARNIALGRGFSIADGTIATNGTQPLHTLIYAGGYWLAGGDRIRGLFPVVAVQVLWSILTAIALWGWTRSRFYRGPHVAIVAAVAGTLFFISPTSVMHGQNSLETGLYALLILASLALYDRFSATLLSRTAIVHSLLLGALLGVTFLARNDACLLIAALIVVHLVRVHRKGALPRGLLQCLVIGLTSIAAASPWLWYNVTRFGHLVPVSGRAEAHNIAFAHNLWPAFVAVLENAMLVVRVPGALEHHPAVVGVAVAVVLAAPVIAFRHRRWLTAHFSPGVGILALFVLGLFFYYALFFGMPVFLGRYFIPLVPLMCLLAASLLAAWLARSPARTRVPPAIVPVALAAVLAIALNARIYRNGTKHHHFQVVDWVRDNVPETTWAGATQTGTLGYYHDYTINLDGKVNPTAFEYRKQGRIPEYCVKVGVEYIVDWAGHAAWADIPAFAENYELLLVDYEKDLAVLRRRPRSADATP